MKLLKPLLSDTLIPGLSSLNPHPWTLIPKPSSLDSHPPTLIPGLSFLNQDESTGLDEPFHSTGTDGLMHLGNLAGCQRAQGMWIESSRSAEALQLVSLQLTLQNSGNDCLCWPQE